MPLANWNMLGTSLTLLLFNPIVMKHCYEAIPLLSPRRIWLHLLCILQSGSCRHRVLFPEPSLPKAR